MLSVADLPGGFWRRARNGAVFIAYGYAGPGLLPFEGDVCRFRYW
jgi:hypothetical protein